MNVLWLGDPRSFDVGLVGGKTASLSRLARLRQRVPDGFCLPATALDETLPLELRDDIARALAALMACHGHQDLAVAVRSSAVEEDSASASFAGQHETYLNVQGMEDIVQAIARCRDSARSERVLEYRRQHGLCLSWHHRSVWHGAQPS